MSVSALQILQSLPSFEGGKKQSKVFLMYEWDRTLGRSERFSVVVLNMCNSVASFAVTLNQTVCKDLMGALLLAVRFFRDVCNFRALMCIFIQISFSKPKSCLNAVSSPVPPR